MNLIFEDIFGTLCRSQNDPDVIRVFESLGNGTRRVVQHLVYMDYFDQGVSWLFDEKLCVSSVFFFSEGRHKYHRAYSGSFPGTLRFGASREDVRNTFDQLIASSEGEEIACQSSSGSWDKFAYQGNTIHVEYSGKNQSVSMVTIACGKGQVEQPSPENHHSFGLMKMLRRWFKPRRTIGIRQQPMSLLMFVAILLPVSHGAFTTCKPTVQPRAETAVEVGYANEGFRYQDAEKGAFLTRDETPQAR